MAEQLLMRRHGSPGARTLVYLPGLHGDWTLVTRFRNALRAQIQFVEFTYPRTVTWSLDDYAAAIERALTDAGIEEGWVLGESFGSQVAWALLQRTSRPHPNPAATTAAPGAPRFGPRALILAGGFVRHPALWGVRFAHTTLRRVRLENLTRVLAGYSRLVRFRGPQGDDVSAGFDEFVARRTEPDRQAALHRLRLIEGSDFRDFAATQSCPVYHLAGLVDPIVPWPWTRRWLKRRCGALRATRLIWRCDHNVLTTAPGAAARQVLAWIDTAAPAR